MRNLDFIRSLPEGFTVQELGARLYEALSDVDAQQKTIAQQTNTDPTGQPLPPPAIDGLSVTGQNGHFHLQIQHGGEFYRGVQYHAEYADNPSFHKPHAIDMGTSREHTVSLGNGTYYWRAFAAYASSPAGPVAYHGGAHSPQPVSGGGIVGPPALLDPQGSGTGAPGEGLSGPGPIPFRTSTGRPPIRGKSAASGGSSDGSLLPSPQTGLPEGIASLGVAGGGPWSPQLVTVTQSGLAGLAATLNTGSAGLAVYVSDFDHTLVWTGTGWRFASGERSCYVEAFLIDPSPTTGWALCDGATVTYLKSDGTTGTIPLPDLVSAPASAGYLKFGTPASSTVNAAVAPGMSGRTEAVSAGTPAGTVAGSTSSDSAGTPAGGISGVAVADHAGHTHSITQSSFAGTNFLTGGATAAYVSGGIVSSPSGGPSASLSHTVTNDGTFSGSAMAGHGHTFSGALSGTALGTHDHGVGSLAVDATAEPRNLILRPWFRL